jgi:hypothetical protein
MIPPKRQNAVDEHLNHIRKGMQAEKWRLSQVSKMHVDKSVDKYE